MKTISVNIYSAQELKNNFPAGFSRALNDWQNRGEIFWQEDIVNSLKELYKHAGIRLTSWSLGAYNRDNFVELSFPHDDVEEFTGKRALAWIENNLLSSLRISFTASDRWELSKYGNSYRPGLVRPCPFTGYCFDEDFLADLFNAVRSGDTLKEAFEGLADTCQELLENEAEDQASEEYFLEHAEANEYEFTEDGELR